MALYVNTNVAALGGQKNLMDVTSRMNSSFEKLSSGSRINSAKDDAAGLQISDRLTTQVIGLEQATRNANDGISIAQIAEGALSEVTNNIQRMRQLVVQGGNRTLSSNDRDALGQEFEKLLNVNNDIADRTAFGTQKILNYEASAAGFQVQTGAYAGEQDTITTGNAKLTAMFGKVLKDEVADGTIAAGVSLSALSDTALSALGTIGKCAGVYMAHHNETDVGNAIDALVGLDVGAQLGVANLSQLDTLSTIELNIDELTDMLTNEVSVVANALTNESTIGAFTSTFVEIAATDVNSVTGFNDEQINTLNAFATDTLLDFMGDLVTQVDKQRAKLGAEQNGLTSVIRNNTTAVVNVSDSRSRIRDTDFAAETAELTRNQIIQQAATTILSQANQLPQTALTLLG